MNAGCPFFTFINIASISKLHKLTFTSNLTFLVGENGSGKSTMIEALAIALGFNSEGGTKNFQFSTRQTHSELYQYLRLCFNLQKPQDGFFTEQKAFITSLPI
ncbi:AAA family ATPase [Shewanella indica]|uniref:AAA family ATPase n=2 Tax=Shewanella indica TaxID=768528 RepID=UPI00384ED18D